MRVATANTGSSSEVELNLMSSSETCTLRIAISLLLFFLLVAVLEFSGNALPCLSCRTIHDPTGYDTVAVHQQVLADEVRFDINHASIVRAVVFWAVYERHDVSY